MKRTWWVVPAAALLLAACDMRSPAQKKKEAEEEARRKAAAAAPPVRPEPPEEGHVLVKADPAMVTAIQRPSVGLIKIDRSGVIGCALLTYFGANIKRENVGASSLGGGCCTSSDPPEFQAMGGTFRNLRNADVTADSPPCDEPVVVDGDHKAPWLHVRKIVEIMSRARMTRLVFATSAAERDMKGVVAKLPAGWNVTDPLPAKAKQVEVAAKGKELAITIDGTVHKDVASAVAALQKAGVTEIGIHPADSRTPLWAVVKGIELSNSIAPAGPVRFVMVDR
jgi:biopolymer transport protein ExbD